MACATRECGALHTLTNVCFNSSALEVRKRPSIAPQATRIADIYKSSYTPSYQSVCVSEFGVVMCSLERTSALFRSDSDYC